MDGKAWYKSKMILFNILSGIVGVGMALQSPEVGLNPQVVSILATVVTVGNVILRLVTNKPIGEK